MLFKYFLCQFRTISCGHNKPNAVKPVVHEQKKRKIPKNPPENALSLVP